MARSRADVTRGRDLTTADFRGEARDVARDLVGTLLLNHDGSSASPVGGLIVETEAYVNAVDSACHLTGGRTPRTESFFSGPGTLYVYTMHGHHALNLITTLDDHPEGILIRAIEPTHGIDTMAERRGFDVEESTLLASGPGRLTEALGITKAEFDDHPLSETSLAISETDWNPDVDVTGRIGVTSARDWPLRFVASGSEYVSKTAPDVDLDYAVVEDAYQRLLRDDLPTVDDSRRT